MKSLPEDFLLYFYSNWLQLVDFGRLDSALTEHKTRLRQRELFARALQPATIDRTILKLPQCEQGFIQAIQLNTVPLLPVMNFLTSFGYSNACHSGIRISFTPVFFQEFETQYKGVSFPLVEAVMIDGVNWNNETLRMFRVFELFPNLAALSINCISKTTMFYQSFFKGIQESKVVRFTVLSQDVYPSYSLSFIQYTLGFTGHRLEVCNTK